MLSSAGDREIRSASKSIQMNLIAVLCGSPGEGTGVPDVQRK